MRCPICDTNDQANWKNVDQYRFKPVGMSLCQTCGFISYPNKWKSKAEIVQFYKKGYRKTNPNATSLFQGERKCQYHAAFLSDVIDQWRAAGRKNMLVCDVGSAFGMALDWFRSHFDRKEVEVYGIDLTPSYVRNAWHLYGIVTKDDLDDTKKHDLIISYKSHEHILDPDVELKRYLAALKDDGLLYYSVPLWFDVLQNFGMAGFDPEYYYSPNHVNTWTRKHVEGMIGFCGGEIIKSNRTIYGDTYLIKKRSGPPTERKEAFEDPAKIEDALRRVMEAHNALQARDWDKCLKAWPAFPVAHQMRYEYNRKEFHEHGFEWIYKNVIEVATTCCPHSPEIQYFAADLCARYDAYDKAIEHLQRQNEMQPQNPAAFALLSNCFRSLAEKAVDVEDRIRFTQQARQAATILKDSSRQHFVEAVNWIMFDNANIPAPFETVQGVT